LKKQEQNLSYLSALGAPDERGTFAHLTAEEFEAMKQKQIEALKAMNMHIRCEMPNTDEVRIFRTEAGLAAYLSDLGNPEFVRVGNTVTIPSFAEGRKTYSDAKQLDCNRWGCN
jgi:hypothetical protein